MTTNIGKIAQYCKAHKYNLLSFDIEGVSGDIGDAVNKLCAAVKQQKLGVILTLPGYGVESKWGSNKWFAKVDQNNVDKLCLMYYNQNLDTATAPNPGGKGYTADDIKKYCDPVILKYPPEKRILGVSCKSGDCGGLATDSWVQSNFKGGVSSWARKPTVATNWNAKSSCPL